MTLFQRVLLVIAFTAALPVSAGSGKLIGTAGLNQLEGAGGGGIVPWATLSGYDSDSEVSVNAFLTRVNLDDYRLQVAGASVSLYDRVEVSVARQTFDLTTLGGDISQNIYGAKVRLWGDVVYSAMPQISAGVQFKDLQDEAIANALGSADTSGTDYYVSATKVHLGAVAGYNLVWNLTARMTNANQMGLLGFGQTSDDDYEVMLEGSVGVLLNRNVAVGAEYRQKPDNLGLGEEDWWDVFVTYIPSKSFNVTLAWAELGSIAGAPDQNGIYLSLGGQLW
ncbi:DUF3034 family protein [Alteromonas confluentis]|uniref:DUF3034 domain-containing protein n=1 Tax=Alteromonas confluentis TaxID=1656094 RepID=A0A1E7ZGE9_9ALTE|nr:DUF3034 family protein [Alteromonas confluentis]OFC72550.1 hypothetical protein BFC18_03085 [Alteromonas confluentis]